MKGPAAIFFVLISVVVIHSTAASQRKPKFSLKDSLDHKLDLSDWIINANGFVPVPVIITEPALGNFGFGIAPVFLKKKPPIVTDGKATPVPPDITAVAAAYTLNKTWFVGGGRMATIPKLRLRYKIGAGYANVNMDYYREVANQGEQQFGFNLKTVVAYGYLARQLHDPRFQIGMQYLFLNVKLKLQNGSQLPDFVKEKEVKSNISELGVVGEYDSRDNIFTPDRGVKIHTHVNFSDNIFGSSYDYQRLNSYLYWYVPVFHRKESGKNWISGFRVDYQQMWGDPPFFILPYVDLRGIPTMRYQGKVNILAETEQRWDFVRRWSLLAFGGLGKAFNDYSEFGDAELVYNYGAGFRYLLARKFRLRCGIDIARGPGNWAYYIVFGSYWRK